MKFKLSLIYTALFAGVSVSVLAETQHKASTETIEQINVQDTGIKLMFKIQVLNKMAIKRQEHPSYQKLKYQYSTRQTQ